MTAIYTLSCGLCTAVDLLFMSMRRHLPPKGGVRELRKGDKHRLCRDRMEASLTPAVARTGSAPAAAACQTRHCAKPCKKMSRGRSMPMKTILLWRVSPSAHCGPRSLPISWCTPWKITLRSVPFMFRTPL